MPQQTLPATLDDTRTQIRDLEDALSAVPHGAPEAGALIDQLDILRPHAATLRAQAAR